MTVFQSIRHKLFSQQIDLEDIRDWRDHVLSIILFVVVILGTLVAIPSVLLAVSEGLWSVSVIDVIALAWVVTIWRKRALSFLVRAWNLCALIYLLGLAFLFTVGAASEIYLMAFPVMAALLLGLRPALFALVLNAVTLLGVGYLADADLHVIGFEAEPLLKWIVITLNFTFANALITLSSVVLLNGLEKSLDRKRDSEELYRASFECAPIGVSRLDLDGRWLQVNRKLCEITGYSRDEMLGLSFQDITHPEDIESEAAGIRALILGEIESLDREKRYIRKGGNFVWVQLRTSLVRAASGEPKYFVAVATDITERKRVEDELSIAAISFESQQGMMITDADWVILRVNRTFTEDTGYTVEETVGQTPDMLKSNRHNAAFYAAMWETLHRTGTWQGEIWNRHKNGEVYPYWLTISAVRGHDGAFTHYVGTQIDISQRKAAEDQIHKLAFYDPLTQLPNRRLLLDRLSHALAGSTRSNRQGAIMFIDLDNFKTLNDTQGHDVGDRLLIEAAQRVQSSVRQGDTVARLGGDEFVVMLEGLEADGLVATRVEGVAEKILAALGDPYRLEIRTGSDKHSTIDYHCTASIGVTLFGTYGENIEELLKQADLAMYQAKDSGRNTIRFFDLEMQATVTARVALEDDLREAIQKGQFRLHYQAQVMGEGRVTGAEVLVRWQHPQRGMVSPAEFIPLAEETGLILPLGRWVLETACAQLAAWAVRPEMAHLTIAVNVSAHQFRQRDFVDQVLTVLANTGADPQRLKLELTESLLISNVEEVIEKMFALKAKGVGFSLDDFGTGYSSLAYLKRLPLDQLKIDQSFVRDVLSDPNDAAIAKTIIALAESLGLGVIAEGVETATQRDFLASSGCHAYQGYFYSRPLAIDAFELFTQRV
jgi:diguanylate cyclase (GGDEF)-like protein/PAS domain S-box-containing protein